MHTPIDNAAVQGHMQGTCSAHHFASISVCQGKSLNLTFSCVYQQHTHKHMHTGKHMHTHAHTCTHTHAHSHSHTPYYWSSLCSVVATKPGCGIIECVPNSRAMADISEQMGFGCRCSCYGVLNLFGLYTSLQLRNTALSSATSLRNLASRAASNSSG